MNTLIFWMTDLSHKKRLRVTPLTVVIAFAWVLCILATMMSFGNPKYIIPLIMLILVTLLQISWMILKKIVRVMRHSAYMANLTERGKVVVTRTQRRRGRRVFNIPEKFPRKRVIAAVVGLYCLIGLGLAISWNYELLYWSFIVLGIALTEMVVALANNQNSNPAFSVLHIVAFTITWCMAVLFANWSLSRATAYMVVLWGLNIVLMFEARKRTRTQ